MTRWALLLEYDGTGFVGWQRQAAGQSVQGALEEAAARLSDGPVACTAAGRTDSGVHAAGQVAHLDLAREIAPEKLAAALNHHVRPHPVCVLRAAVVPPRWSARFSAIGRAYRYTLLNRASPPMLRANRVWHVPHPLDLDAMRQAAELLTGRHDFSSFRAKSCQAASPVRTLDRLSLHQSGETIEIVAEARSFLHHQVRNIVGTLKLVGEGVWAPARVTDALAARRREAAGPTAPAAGLCLMSVAYPADPFGMPIGADTPGTFLAITAPA